MDASLPAMRGPDSEEPAHRIEEARASGRRRRRRRRSADRTPPAYAWCDRLTEALILFLVVFTPWAFGTTQSWSIWVANVACYALGLVLVAKAVLRRRLGFRPSRWGEEVVVVEETGEVQAPVGRVDLGTRVLAVLTALVLGYLLVSALNARADYDEATQSFQYRRDPLSWLPFTYDVGATWFAFAQYLGLACAFWAARDWLLHRSPADSREHEGEPHGTPSAGQVVIPVRLRRLLWVICLNGALLAVVSIIQRADGTNKLLWILPSRSDKPAESLFGPWSYRANAAQYFNLVWPVCLAFWLWAQERVGRAMTRRLSRFDGPQLVLLPCAVFAGVCPMISGSRGGAIVSVLGGGLAALMILLISRREVSAGVRWVTAGGMVVAGLAAFVGGWSMIRERLSQPDSRFATGIEAATNDFTLLVRLKLPEQPDGKWRSLLSLVSNARYNWPNHSLQVALAGRGEIVTQLRGDAATNVLRSVATNVIETYAGQEVLLGFVRQNGMRVLANGTELGAVEGRRGLAPTWNDYVFTRYVFVSSPAVSEVALVNFAMTADEVRQAAGAPLSALEDSLLSATPFRGTDPASGRIDVPEGAVAEVMRRPTDDTVPWLAVRRSIGSGPLGFQQVLEGLDPRLRGPMEATFTVWNTGNEALQLGARLDDGPMGWAEVPPRGEHTVSIPCRAPHGGVPERLEVYLLDEEGEGIADAPESAQFLVRDLHLTGTGAVFARQLVREFRLIELSDRMTGRQEYYENAVRMVKDYPIWGSGAGSFAAIYQFYLQPGQDWAGYLHNDWLEMRITLGAVGLSLIVAALAALAARSWFGGGLRTLRIVVALCWLALGGCMLHARYDFPFQIYSVLFLFILLCAVLTVLTGSRRTR